MTRVMKMMTLQAMIPLTQMKKTQRRSHKLPRKVLHKLPRPQDNQAKRLGRAIKLLKRINLMEALIYCQTWEAVVLLQDKNPLPITLVILALLSCNSHKHSKILKLRIIIYSLLLQSTNQVSNKIQSHSLIMYLETNSLNKTNGKIKWGMYLNSKITHLVS